MKLSFVSFDICKMFAENGKNVSIEFVWFGGYTDASSLKIIRS